MVTGEGISCRNSSWLKSKQGVSSHDKAHSCNELAPFFIVFERVKCVFQQFLFFRKFGSSLKIVMVREVQSTRMARAEKVKENFIWIDFFFKIKESPWIWSWRSHSGTYCLPEQLGLKGLMRTSTGRTLPIKSHPEFGPERSHCHHLKRPYGDHFSRSWPPETPKQSYSF